MNTNLLVAASRLRTVLISGFAAGVCVFFAPMLVLAVGLLAAYLSDLASDGHTPVFGLSRPLEASDFRAVFAPVVNAPILLVGAGGCGAGLAALRRALARRADPAMLAAGIRPFFPEFAASYVLLTLYLLAAAASTGSLRQVHRLAGVTPMVLLFLLCATWLAHAVWQYCFRNVLDLLATTGERSAAGRLLTGRRPLPRPRPAR